MLTHDRDEELSMFLEMRRRDKERRGESSLAGSDNTSINGALTSALSGVSETVSSQRFPLRRTAAENFLYSENEKSDYDWLLTPPGTPQFEKESHKSVMEQNDVTSSRPTALKSRLGNCREDIVSGKNNKSLMSSSSGLSSSSIAGLRRPSSSGSSRSTSRPSTPTRRSTTPTTSTTSRPVTTRASTSRSSTPTSRATLTAARATSSTTAPRTTTSARSATPTRSTTQPSSAPSKKPVSRPATPTRRSPTPNGPSIVSSKAPSRGTSPTPTPTGSSIVSTKAPSRGTSPTPTLKSSKTWKPREMPGFSLEVPPNLRTSVSDRPVSATRGRPGVASAPGSRSNSIERGNGPTSNGVGHVRRQSCSPSRGRAPIGNTNGSLPGARGRGKANNGDSPVAMGNKMVERVVNMRKLGPPRLTESGGRGSAKSSSAFNSLGYGRNLSKSSIDMALRHMVRSLFTILSLCYK
ncbi:Uncharacterized protein HA466_0275520 [Hirschfeldia incana]|nr:Uncharacterized protein HA466_0275520 [Hirschfeldia incana]